MRGSLAALSLLVACGGGGTPAPAPSGEPAKDTLVVAYASDMDSLNPVVSSSASDSAIIDQVLEPLVDSDFDCSLKKLPALAKDWTWSEDGKTLTMTLDDRYKWADGKPVGAEDIKFTYDLIGDPNVGTPRASYLKRLTADGRPKIIDATHIEWDFTEAYDRDTQISHVSMNPVPKHVLDTADRATLKGAPFSKSPLPNGPWKVAKYEAGQQIVLEPNEAFTGPDSEKPKLGRVIFRVIPEYATRLLELESGKVDMMESVRVQDADEIRAKNPDINLVRRGWRGMDFVAWNLTDPKFADKNVRKALAMSVNIDDTITKMFTSKSGDVYARPAIGTITPELCSAYNDDVKPLPFDPTQAKALFAAAGWTDTNGDGVIDKDGQKFSFTMMTNQGNQRRADAAIRLQSYFKDVGVEMNIEQVEFNAMVDRLKKRDFQAAMSGWSAALFVDPSEMWHSDAPERKSEFNYTSYNNPDVDALIAKGLSLPDPEQSAPVWRDLQAKIYDDQPYLFLWWTDEIVAISSRFQNAHIDVLSNFHHLYDWSVPPEKVKYAVK